MTLEEAMKRIEALEARLPPAEDPVVEDYEIPYGGWMLVDSSDIPWPNGPHAWELYDPKSPDNPWACHSGTKPPRPYLVVVRPVGNA